MRNPGQDKQKAAGEKKPAAKKKPAAEKPVKSKKRAAAKPVKRKKPAAKKPANKKQAAEAESSGPATTPAPVGVTSQVGVNETWIQVFEKNEKVDDDDRLTDEQISEFMKSEFPDLDAKIFDRVEIARGKFNRGGFHRKDKSGKATRSRVHSKPYAPQDSSGSAIRAVPRKAGAGSWRDRVVTHQKDFKSHKK